MESLKPMKLIDAKRLIPEQQQKLAAAALKARPNAQQRAEFRWLARRWRQHQRIAAVLSKRRAAL
jgi:hypothetical protein